MPRSYTLADRFTGVQAGITIPLWFVPHVAKIKAARLKEQIVKNDAANFNKMLESKYKSLLSEYATYTTSVDYYEQQAIPEANMIIDQLTRSYKAGAVDYLDYINGLGRALTIKLNYLDALNHYNQTAIALECIAGVENKK